MTRLADEMGLLVWSEVPVYWAVQWESKAAYANAEHQLSEMITRDKNRASVVFWSVANETPLGEARTRFLGSLAAKAHNPTTHVWSPPQPCRTTPIRRRSPSRIPWASTWTFSAVTSTWAGTTARRRSPTPLPSKLPTTNP